MLELLGTPLNLMWRHSTSGSCLLCLKGQLGVQFVPFQDLGRWIMALMQEDDSRESWSCARCRVKTELRPGCSGCCPAELWTHHKDKGSTTSLGLCSVLHCTQEETSFAYVLLKFPLFISIYDHCLLWPYQTPLQSAWLSPSWSHRQQLDLRCEWCPFTQPLLTEQVLQPWSLLTGSSSSTQFLYWGPKIRCSIHR